MADYSVDLDLNKLYLSVKASGKVEGIMNMMEYSGVAIAKAFEHGYSKVLVDERDVEIHLSDHDQHELMNFFLNDFPKSLNLKFAAVYSPKNESVAKFFEDLSSRVGFDCKFFLTINEAKEYLEI